MQDVRVGALHPELVAVQHQLHLAIVACGLLDEGIDLRRQLHLHIITSQSISPCSYALAAISNTAAHIFFEVLYIPPLQVAKATVVSKTQHSELAKEPRLGVAGQKIYGCRYTTVSGSMAGRRGRGVREQLTHLGQPVQHSDNGLGVEPNADSGIEGVRREDILVHALGAAHWFRNSNQEVICLSVHRRESLQEDAPVRTHPQGPACKQVLSHNAHFGTKVSRAQPASLLGLLTLDLLPQLHIYQAKSKMLSLL